jgi:hypothetical protein
MCAENTASQFDNQHIDITRANDSLRIFSTVERDGQIIDGRSRLGDYPSDSAEVRLWRKSLALHLVAFGEAVASIGMLVPALWTTIDLLTTLTKINTSGDQVLKDAAIYSISIAIGYGGQHISKQTGRDGEKLGNAGRAGEEMQSEVPQPEHYSNRFPLSRR